MLSLHAQSDSSTRCLSKWLLTACVGLLTCNTGYALSLTSGKNQVPLLELYTSEGCSSCPSADKWLNRLQNDKNLFTAFVPIAFHVDYWNYLGWKDPFSNPLFTKRQRAFAAIWGTGTIYTPGFVFNGTEWKKWRWKKTLPAWPKNHAGILQVTLDTQNSNVSFQPRSLPTELPNTLIAHLAILGFDLRSKVRSGENRGKNFQHQFVVIGYTQNRLLKKKQAYSGTLPVPVLCIPAPQKMGIACWVSGGNNPTPLQAVGGWLTQSESKTLYLQNGS